jgi:hypothetical protein
MTPLKVGNRPTKAQVLALTLAGATLLGGCVVSRPYVVSATYQSPRGIGQRDVTDQVRSQCLSAERGCIVDCNNNLAGDPDFGYVKSCKIEYKCPSGATQTLEAIEMEPTRLSCR